MQFLNARLSAVGGNVASALAPASMVPATTTLILLIHGYNVTQQGGMDSYNDFLALFSSKNGLRGLETFGDVWGYLWPGDSNLGFFSAISYPTSFSNVSASANLLAQFLVGLQGPGGSPLRLFLVCHSLGGRLMLEMVRQFNATATPSSPRIAGYCLMAAAVPVSMISDLNQLGQTALSATSRILFSKSDRVLHYAFPPGETAAFEGFFPEAVGRFGNPSGTWTATADLAPYDHGDYFEGKPAGSGDSARQVGQIVGDTVQPAPQVNSVMTNTLPDPRVATTVRSIASRVIGSM